MPVQEPKPYADHRRVCEKLSRRLSERSAESAGKALRSLIRSAVRSDASHPLNRARCHVPEKRVHRKQNVVEQISDATHALSIAQGARGNRMLLDEHLFSPHHKEVIRRRRDEQHGRAADTGLRRSTDARENGGLWISRRVIGDRMRQGLR